MTDSDSYAKEVLPVNLEDEMRKSYLDYAMSVIIGRALPDVCDGLKPVHRRVLYAMRELGNDWNKPYKKSARIVGDVIGKYHPHGDVAVYDTIVRMAQPFSLRYMLVDGQGNFGSVDGDAPAAMRYTEVRMAKIAHELLADLDKETVDFVPNYDNSEKEPLVLPTRVPNLLVNGSAGIAVGMATNIPPHNLAEVVGAALALIDDPEISIDGLIKHLPGPDFPTAAIIKGRHGIVQAYHTGRGRVVVRARCRIDRNDKADRETIVVTELPYMVNKARLLEKIAELVKEKRVEGIAALRDESDKDGMRVVIELKRGEAGDIVLNNLFRHTPMQSAFGVNMVALDNGQPKLLNLKEVLEAFIRHRREVVTRRTVFDLRKAREKAHLLEGQAVALANIDEVIALIKASKTPAEAKAALMKRVWKPGVVTRMLERADTDASRPESLPDAFGLMSEGYRLSDKQAQAILDLRLHRLTALEQDKIVSDYESVIKTIYNLIEILSEPDRLMEVIREELAEVRETYADERRTEISDEAVEMTDEDFISEEEVVITISHAGYAKSQSPDEYRLQRRGGKGKAATSVREEDFVDTLFIANTHDTLLCFSSAGKIYWLKVYRLPRAGRAARGRPLVNLLPLEEGERITTVLPVREFSPHLHVLMATSSGTVKRTSLDNFSRPRSNGIRAITLRDGDQMIGAQITDGEHDVMLFSDSGRSVRFSESELRSMGRSAQGVRGIRLRDAGRAISLICLPPPLQDDSCILIATENGYGKRTAAPEFPRKKRGGLGVIAIRTDERNGKLVGATLVGGGDEVMLITDGGTLVRTEVDQISLVGRNTKGVRLIRLQNGEQLCEAVRVDATVNGGNGDDGDDGNNGNGGGGAAVADIGDSAAAGSDDAAADADSDTTGATAADTDADTTAGEQ